MASKEDPLEAAMRRMSATVDDVWEILRQRRAADASAAYRVATLSSSLADPRGYDVEIFLTRALPIADSDADRAALVQIVRSCQAQNLLALEPADRLVRKITKA